MRAEAPWVGDGRFVPVSLADDCFYFDLTFTDSRQA